VFPESCATACTGKKPQRKSMEEKEARLSNRMYTFSGRTNNNRG
jgi:hypothetical protein